MFLTNYLKNKKTPQNQQQIHKKNCILFNQQDQKLILEKKIYHCGSPEICISLVSYGIWPCCFQLWTIKSFYPCYTKILWTL